MLGSVCLAPSAPGIGKDNLLPAHKCSIFPEENCSVKNGRSVVMTGSKALFLSILQILISKHCKRIYGDKEGSWDMAPQPLILLCGKLTLENLRQRQKCPECTPPLQQASDLLEGFLCFMIKLNVFPDLFDIK